MEGGKTSDAKYSNRDLQLSGNGRSTQQAATNPRDILMLQLRDIAARPDRNTGPETDSTKCQMIVKLTKAERDTILAALRRWQSYPAAREADSIATGGGKHRPLDNAEIERICKRMTKIERKRDAALLLRQSNNGATLGQMEPGVDRQRQRG